MNNNKFAGSVTLLLLVNVIVKLVWIFFIERNIQLNVGFKDYGIYYSLFNYTLILTVINDPGLNNYLIRYLSKGENRLKEVSELFYIKIILSGLYLVFSLLIAFFLGFRDVELMVLLLAYQLSFSFLTYLRGFLKGYQLLKTDVVFSVLDKSILILAFLPLLYFNQHFIWTIKFYVLTQLVVVLIALILCGFYLFQKNIVVFVRSKLSYNFKLLKEIYPFAVFAFLVLAYNRIDAVMLAKMLPNGAFATGVYVAAYRFLDAATMLPILFASFLYPVMSKFIYHKNKIEELVKSSLVFLLSSAVIIALASWFYRHQMMQLFYGESATTNLSIIFGTLMLCLPFVVLYYVFSTLLTASNSLLLLNLISALGLFINISLNLILIPKYEALGAAVSSLISFSAIGISYLFLYHFYLKYPFSRGSWLKMSGYVFLLVIMGLLFQQLPVYWIFSFIFFVIASVGIGFLFKFFNIKAVGHMMGL